MIGEDNPTKLPNEVTKRFHCVQVKTKNDLPTFKLRPPIKMKREVLHHNFALGSARSDTATFGSTFFITGQVGLRPPIKTNMKLFALHVSMEVMLFSEVWNSEANYFTIRAFKNLFICLTVSKFM